MSKVTDPGEEHSHVMLVDCRDHFVISNRTPRLHYGGYPVLRRFVNSVPKRKESVGGQNSTFQFFWIGFHGRQFTRVDPAHLARPDTDSLVLIRQDNGV